MKLTIRKKSSHYALMARCDELARRACLARPMPCEAAGNDGIECRGRSEWAHIRGRAVKCIRHLPENCLKCCSAHHEFYTDNPGRWRRMIEEKYPGRWFYLDSICRRNDKVDFKTVLARLQEEQNGGCV